MRMGPTSRTSWTTCAAAVLVLAGCAGTGDDEDAAAEQQEGPEATKQGDAGEAVPVLSDIEDDIWGSMLAAESVHVAIENDEVVGNLSNVPGTDVEAFRYSGAVDGSAIAVHYGDIENAQLYFPDATYIGDELTFRMFDEVDEDADIAALRQDLDGHWMLGESFDPEEMDFRLSELIADFRVDGSEADGQGSEVSDGGVAEVRDGEEVWVYPLQDGGGELVLAADREAPYLLALTTDDLRLEFSDWNEAEIPSRPDPEAVLPGSAVETMAIEAGLVSQGRQLQEQLEELEELLED